MIKNRIAKLIDVKSIVTIVLTILFFILGVTKVIDGQSVITIYTTIIAFYFGTQYEKKNDKLNNVDEKERNEENVS
jgi:hypothetical protein